MQSTLRIRCLLLALALLGSVSQAATDPETAQRSTFQSRRV
ncbi:MULTISPECIES: hypothetical protein [Pseudomonas]|nr:hypothetical protein [Pseudomonas fluorescens]